MLKELWRNRARYIGNERGEMKFGGGTGKSTSTQTRNVAPMSAQENMLQEMNIRGGQQQMAELQRAMQSQQQYEQSGGFQQAQQLGTQAGGLLQQDMAGGQLISSPQEAALQKYFQSIMAPQQQQMQRTASEEAARRGMTISDSPIGNAYLQNLSNYASQMGGQQAGQALQLQQNNRGMYQNQMGMGQQLQQNAQQNRLALSQAQPGSYGMGNQLAQSRIASAPVTTMQSGSKNAPSYGFSLGDVATGAARGMQAYHGVDPKYGTPGIKDWWAPSNPNSLTG